MDLDTKKATEREYIAAYEIIRRKIRLESTPAPDSIPDLARVFESGFDEDVEITGCGVRNQRQNRDSADDYLAGAFDVECIEEIGKVLGHDPILGRSRVCRRFPAGMRALPAAGGESPAMHPRLPDRSDTPREHPEGIAFGNFAVGLTWQHLLTYCTIDMAPQWPNSMAADAPRCPECGDCFFGARD